MIPRTYPSKTNSLTGKTEMVVSFIGDISNKTRWIDYIPVSFIEEFTPTENSHNNEGFISVVDIGDTTGKQAGVDYINVHLEQGTTDAWQVSSVGFIPVGFSGLGSVLTLFANNEPGVWYDPSDLSTLYQDSAGTTPVTAVEQPVGLMLDKSRGLVLGPTVATGPWINTYTTKFDTFSSTSGDTFTGTTASAKTGIRVGVPCVFESGKTYQIEFTATLNNSSFVSIWFSDELLSGTGAIQNPAVVASGVKYRIIATAPGDRTHLMFLINTSGAGTVDVTDFQARELPGHHATQPTATSRPVLSSRYNLLTKTEDFSDAAWTKANATVTANAVFAPDGTLTADKIVEDTATSEHIVSVSAATLVPEGNSISVSCYMKAGTGRYGLIRFSLPSGYQNAIFDLKSGTVSSAGIEMSASIRSVGDGWYRCAVSGNRRYGAYIVFGLSNGTSNSYTGDGTSGIYIWGAQLIATNSLPSNAYQRVNTATDYDADFSKFPPYLKCDGVDDWMSTGSIDFTSTDKMTVCAGVRKLSDAASGMFAELSASLASNSGTFAIQTPGVAGSADIRWNSKGTSAAVATYVNTSVASPVTFVFTGYADISSDVCRNRINGIQVVSNISDQGTGTYGNYPLYLFRRGGTTLPFNGHFYGLVIRGAQSTDAQINALERYLANKTGVQL